MRVMRANASLGGVSRRPGSRKARNRSSSHCVDIGDLAGLRPSQRLRAAGLEVSLIPEAEEQLTGPREMVTASVTSGAPLWFESAQKQRPAPILPAGKPSIALERYQRVTFHTKPGEARGAAEIGQIDDEGGAHHVGIELAQQ